MVNISDNELPDMVPIKDRFADPLNELKKIIGDDREGIDHNKAITFIVSCSHAQKFEHSVKSGTLPDEGGAVLIMRSSGWPNAHVIFSTCDEVNEIINNPRRCKNSCTVYSNANPQGIIHSTENPPRN